MSIDDFIMTIDSDEEAPIPLPKSFKTIKTQKPDIEDAQLNADLIFDLSGDPYADMIEGKNVYDFVKKGSRPVRFCWSPSFAITH